MMTNEREIRDVYPAIFFEPDGYVLSDLRPNGRKSAGNGFLRAAVAARHGRPIWAYTPHERSAHIFAQLVRSIDPAADARWVPAGRLDILGKLGTLYLPDAELAAAARLRLRSSPAAYSICGITHTVAGHQAMDGIISMLSAPVMPWDALICTSTAVEKVVRTLLHGEIDYLRWRFGNTLKIKFPYVKTIPLGVHCSDFSFTEEKRRFARSHLGIGDDEVAALYAGRISYLTKANPYPMYRGLQGAAEQTERNIVLIQCGWFGTPSEEEHFKASLAQDCTNIRIISIDSRISENRYRCWAAADFFISLSDNIQESFGLTPVEAMASGLPAVVTDWDGYKETVRDGTDGFRIPTWMPPADSGGLLAEAYEAGVDPYAVYVGLVAQSVSLDLHLLVERLTALIVNPELRRRMGEAGRNRAQTVFDWKLIYQRYEDLWEELAGIRRFAAKESNRESLIQGAPRFAPSRMDPFRLFRHYSSSSIKTMTTVSVCPSARSLDFARFVEHPIFAWAQKALPPVKLANYLLRTIEPEESIASICHRTGIRVAVLTRTLSVLAKMGLVRLRPGGQSPRNES